MTLIEILIVVTLLGLLAGVLVKSLGGSLEAGRESTANLFATKTVRSAVESYQAVNGKMPTELGDIMPYLPDREIPQTPWGGNYTIDIVPGQPLKNKFIVKYANGEGNEVKISVMTGEPVK